MVNYKEFLHRLGIAVANQIRPLPDNAKGGKLWCLVSFLHAFWKTFLDVSITYHNWITLSAIFWIKSENCHNVSFHYKIFVYCGHQIRIYGL